MRRPLLCLWGSDFVCAWEMPFSLHPANTDRQANTDRRATDPGRLTMDRLGLAETYENLKQRAPAISSQRLCGVWTALMRMPSHLGAPQNGSHRSRIETQRAGRAALLALNLRGRYFKNEDLLKKTRGGISDRRIGC